MQTSFTTMSQLMLALLASAAIAAPLNAGADDAAGDIVARAPQFAKRDEAVEAAQADEAPEVPKIEARRDSRCQDMGFGCVYQCYGSNCKWAARYKPAKREEVEAAEVAEADEPVEAPRLEARRDPRCPDKGFGCVYQCYGDNCKWVQRSKPAKRDEAEAAEAAEE